MRSQFLRFLLVGGLNAAFGYAVFALLLYVGMHYTLALLLATVLGVVFNFFSTGGLVFKSLARHQFPRFIATYVLIYLIQLGCLRLLSGLGLSMYLAAALQLLPMAILGFVLNKKFVFGK